MENPGSGKLLYTLGTPIPEAVPHCWPPGVCLKVRQNEAEYRLEKEKKGHCLDKSLRLAWFYFP